MKIKITVDERNFEVAVFIAVLIRCTLSITDLYWAMLVNIFNFRKFFTRKVKLSIASFIIKIPYRQIKLSAYFLFMSMLPSYLKQSMISEVYE